MPTAILKNQIRVLFTVLTCGLINFCYAQPPEQYIKVIVAPDHADWIYTTGEKVKFRTTTPPGAIPVGNVPINL